MANLNESYGTFVNALFTAEKKELEEFKAVLDNIQEEDYGPGGEIARAVEEHVDFVLEERRREGA